MSDKEKQTRWKLSLGCNSHLLKIHFYLKSILPVMKAVTFVEIFIMHAHYSRSLIELTRRNLNIWYIDMAVTALNWCLFSTSYQLNISKRQSSQTFSFSWALANCYRHEPNLCKLNISSCHAIFAVTTRIHSMTNHDKPKRRQSTAKKRGKVLS